jgi:sec-independent protein translocase protein TatC
MALVPFPGPQQAGALGPASEPDEEPLLEGQMSFLEHLDELRKRIVRSCLAVAFGIAVTFVFIQPIFNFIFEPTRRALPPGVKLIYTQPGEAFSLYVTVALIAGVVVAAPVIMYQVWMFIAPGLYSNEKKFVVPFVLFSTLGFLAGAAFNHYVAYPFIMIYFASFNTPSLTYMPQLSEVFGLYVKMLLGLGVVFQMPTVVYFLAKIRIVTARFLLSQFKYAILIIVILAAVITPTGDPVTLMVFSAPMVGLYVVSIGIAWMVGPKRLKSDETA